MGDMAIEYRQEKPDLHLTDSCETRFWEPDDGVF
jgi:hypothetical protein